MAGHRMHDRFRMLPAVSWRSRPAHGGLSRPGRAAPAHPRRRPGL